MRASFRGRVGLSALVLLSLTGVLGPFAPSVARSDDGLLGVSAWNSDAYDDDSPAPWFKLRINALYLNRRAPQSNIVLTESATGKELLNTSQNDPSWAGGTEVNLIHDFTDTTAFEFDWFSVDDWFDRKQVSFPSIAVDEVPFLVTHAAVSVSSRIRNMEFNLREEIYDGVTLIGGFRYVELLDGQGIHYRNKPFGSSQVVVTDVANRMYGFQIGTQIDLWKSPSWELSTWGKVGIYGNAADNSTGIYSTIPGNAANIRAQDGKTAFVGDLAVRGTRRLGKYSSVFIGYRLMFLDGVALAANQYPGTLTYLKTAIPDIKMGNSMLFQGIEAGLAFSF